LDSTPEDERLLLAEDWAKYVRSFVSDGVRRDGVGDIGTNLHVTADTGMAVKLDVGIASIQGYMFYVEEDAQGRASVFAAH